MWRPAATFDHVDRRVGEAAAHTAQQQRCQQQPPMCGHVAATGRGTVGAQQKRIKLVPGIRSIVPLCTIARRSLRQGWALGTYRNQLTNPLQIVHMCVCVVAVQPRVVGSGSTSLRWTLGPTSSTWSVPCADTTQVACRRSTGHQWGDRISRVTHQRALMPLPADRLGHLLACSRPGSCWANTWTSHKLFVTLTLCTSSHAKALTVVWAHLLLVCCMCCVLQLWNYYNTPGLFKPDKLLESDTTIHDAVVLLLRTWQLEQHHEDKST